MTAENPNPEPPIVPEIVRRDVPVPQEYLPREGRIIADSDSSGRRIFDLSAGESPYGIIPTYNRIMSKLVRSGAWTKAATHYGGGVSEKPAIDFVRQWYGIGSEPYVVFDDEGSDAILETIVLKLIRDPHARKLGIVTVGPTYTHISNFAALHGINEDGSMVLPVNIISDPLEERRPYAETFKKLVGLYDPTDTLNQVEKAKYDLEDAMVHDMSPEVIMRLNQQLQEATKLAEQERQTQIPKLVYVCNPSTPTGELLEPKAIEDFISRITRNHNDIIVVDEAFLFNRNLSTAPLTREFENLIVLDTLSKKAGMAGHRLGLAIMSRGLGEIYDRMRRIYDLHGTTKLLINELFNPYLAEYVEDQERYTRRDKSLFLEELTKRGIRFFDTALESLVMFVDGERDDFHQRLIDRGVITASGVGFASTHPELQAMGSGANRYVRVRIPSGPRRDIIEIAERFEDAAFVEDSPFVRNLHLTP